ncbi:MAG TPA: EthD family reductase [Candidatus Binataceae bacterium]|nr:EthD family reductase [Candidatus Binataceae bacterium]
MLHVHYFITRLAKLDDAEFHRYWRETHGPIAGKIKQVRRYVQSHRIAAPGFVGSSSPYDGEAEVLVDSLAAMAELRKSKEYLDGALADERNFIDLKRVEWMVTQDHVIIDGPSGPNMIKGVWQLKRIAGMPLDEFRRYWIDVHGGLGTKVAGFRRYVQSHLIDEAYLYATPQFDGVAQIWFDSHEAMRAAFETPEGRAMAADGAKFLDMSVTRNFVAQEHVVIQER